jgi:hypothetical protein
MVNLIQKTDYKTEGLQTVLIPNTLGGNYLNNKVYQHGKIMKDMFITQIRSRKRKHLPILNLLKDGD